MDRSVLRAFTHNLPLISYLQNAKLGLRYQARCKLARHSLTTIYFTSWHAPIDWFFRCRQPSYSVRWQPSPGWPMLLFCYG